MGVALAKDLTQSYFNFPASQSLGVMKEFLARRPQLAVEVVSQRSVLAEMCGVVPKTTAAVGTLVVLQSVFMLVRNLLHMRRAESGPPGAVFTLKNGRNPLSSASAESSWAAKTLRSGKNMPTRGEEQRVTFDDVAGLEGAKQELAEIVEFLRRPEAYKEIGATVPRGALLTGAPGCGKTLLARAVAGEADVNFFSLSGSDFVEVYVGVGASRARDLFKVARESGRSIIFIDEIDAVGRRREGGHGGNSNEQENTLNQILMEMDGFESGDEVVVLAATNRVELLDEALTRPGRFDRRIECDLPSMMDREAILNLNMNKLKLMIEDKLIRLQECNPKQLGEVAKWVSRIAATTPGFSGADLKHVMNDSAIIATRDGRFGVSLQDMEDAVERTAFGLRKIKQMPNADMLRRVAIHEAGHAICAWFTAEVDPPLKISITPRMNGMLGFAQQVSQESGIMRRQEVKDKLVVLMGGRVAEEIVLGDSCNGAADDLVKATALATKFVGSWGFAPTEAGLTVIAPTGALARAAGERYAAVVEELLVEAKQRAHDIIMKHCSRLEKLSDGLLQVECLDLQGISELIGVCPEGVPSAELLHYVNERPGLAEKLGYGRALAAHRAAVDVMRHQIST